MAIDRNNYEMYFIDYLEGNLNPEDKEELLKFLSLNPDLKDEFDEFNQYGDVEEENQEYNFKNNLKKDISDLGPVNNNNIDEYCIAYIENDLNENEKSILKDAINENPDYERILKLYQLTKLQPDESVVYKYKKQLKHFVIDRRFIIRIVGYASAAAVIILGIFLFNLSDIDQSVETPIAEIVDESTPVKVIADNQTIEEKNVHKEKTIKLIPVIKEETIEDISIQQDDIIALNQEKNELEVLKPKSINSIENNRNQSIEIIEKTLNDFEIAENKIEPVIDEQQEQIIYFTGNRRSNLWKIAELGVKGFSMLNEKDFALKPSYTNSGKIKSVTFKTSQRRYTAPLI